MNLIESRDVVVEGEPLRLERSARPVMSIQRRKQSPRSSISGCVLCGGASRRMGTDKAELRVSDRTLLEQAISKLDPLCGEILLASGTAERESQNGHRCVFDEVPGAGPLAGIAAALSGAQGDLVCVLACDMPGAETRHYEQLLSKADAESLDACWFTTGGRDEPLFAVYRKTCLSAMRASLAAGQNKVMEFRTQPGPEGRPLRIGTLEIAEEESTCSRNLNTPEDVARERSFGLPDPREL